MDTFGIPETGSSLTWLQCKGYVQCYNQPIPLFNHLPTTQSSVDLTSAIMQLTLYATGHHHNIRKCHYGSGYVLDGSYSTGDIATETFTFPEVTTSDTN
ncbi:hypothetical protein LWI28_009244 [Acer negundo]|uniref:Xylanase inhibitor N-terminal domain-containing protein n=1 Tax=Acer negundo TaxID=4023 RepID=A0AAD5IPS6_ACENE|nr:hypothetical protein LWI28_009244 [Acer negundo]